MSGVPSEEVVDVLGDLAKVSDASQFLHGVQKNPELVFEAVKTLAEHSVGNGSAASQLQSAYQKIIEKEKELIAASNELVIACQNISDLKNSTEASGVFGKLSDVLEKIQLRPYRSADVRDGFVFCGDKKLFPTWKEGIYLKLKSNADQFPTEQSKMAHVYSMLNQDCQAHLHGYIKEGVLKFDSLESMMNELKILFDDPNRVRDAVARIHSNRQRSKPFSSWIAEIRRDAAIAGYENSERLRDIVFLNLSLELEQALIHERDIYNLDFNAAVARLQDIDNRIQAFSQKLAKYRGNRGVGGRNTLFPTIPPTTTQGGDAMDLSAASVRPRAPLSENEKNRRRLLGLCYYCGKKGHSADKCLAKTYRIKNSNLSEEVLGEIEVKMPENE